VARRSDLPPGTLTTLIVNTLAHAPLDGYGIALSPFFTLLFSSLLFSSLLFSSLLFSLSSGDPVTD
jgi:hypothetical protein